MNVNVLQEKILTKERIIIRVAKVKYENRPGVYIDIRRCIMSDGKIIPTRKGVSIPLDMIQEVKECL